MGEKLKRLTPRCGMGQCPAVFEEPGGRLLVIGERLTDDTVRMDREFVAKALEGPISRIFRKLGL